MTDMQNKAENDKKMEELECRLLIRFNVYEKMIADLNSRFEMEQKNHAQTRVYVERIEQELNITKAKLNSLEIRNQKNERQIKDVESEIINFELGLSQQLKQRKVSMSSVNALENENNQEELIAGTGLICKDETKVGQILQEIDMVAADFRNQTILNLSESKVGVQEIKLLKQKNWDHIKELYLSQNQVNDEGLQIICGISWPNLEHLHLALNNITDTGVQYLISANLPKLKTLNLYGNNISGYGAKKICNHSWEKLHKIFIDNNNLTDAQKRDIKDQGHCNLGQLQIQIQL